MAKTAEYVAGGLGLAALVGGGYYFYEKSHTATAPTTAKTHTVTRTVTKTQRINGTPQTIRQTVTKTITVRASQTPRTFRSSTPIRTARSVTSTQPTTRTARASSTGSPNRIFNGLPTPRNGKCPSGYTLSLDGISGKLTCVPACDTGYVSVYSKSQGKWVCIPSPAGISPARYASELTSANSPYAETYNISGLGALKPALKMAQALSARFPGVKYHVILIGSPLTGTYYVVNQNSLDYGALIENSQYQYIVASAQGGSVMLFQNSYPQPTQFLFGEEAASATAAIQAATQLSAAKGIQYHAYYDANADTYYVVASPPRNGMAGVAAAIGTPSLSSALSEIGPVVLGKGIVFPTSKPPQTSPVPSQRTQRFTVKGSPVRLTPSSNRIIHTATNRVVSAPHVLANGGAVSFTAPGTVSIMSSTTIRATATNITSPLYSWWVKNPSGVWKNVQYYSVSNTYTFVPNQTGNWEIVVYAKAASTPKETGTTSRAATEANSSGWLITVS